MDPNNHPVATAEEEALKRNTDCVYFLASPLTCKKGNDCEYRHSEGARMNPRDCWYWLNGNCLNPKCAFRHPPLEGFLATTGATAGSSLVASQTAAPMQMPPAHPTTTHNPNKQSVPCFYFQKGVCLKGDRCSFTHGSQPVINPSQQQTSKVTASITEPPQIIKKATGVLEKCTSQQKTSQIIVKPVEVPPPVNPAIKVEILPNNWIAANRTMPPAPLDNELHRTKPSNVPFTGGNAAIAPHSHPDLPLEEHLQNGMEAGEFLGESSPGFDVLVDNEIEDSDYFHHDDEYGRRASNGGRHLNSINEFDYEHPSELDSQAKFNRESYNEYQDYDQYGQRYDQFGWEHHKASERILDRASMTERRLREESPDQIDRLDLRHRLSKQRKINGSRSATSPTHRIKINRRDDWHSEEERHRGRPRRDQRYFPHETSISNRLQGRIMLPGRSSPDKGSDLHRDGEMDRGRNRGRSSPGRRHHDRIRQSQENFTTEARDIRGQSIKRDEIGTMNFTNPKGLSKLKGTKASVSSGEERSSKNDAIFEESKTRKSGRAMRQLEPEGSLSFEGPKPLSEILKRKREAAFRNGVGSSDGEDGGVREREDLIRSVIAATETPNKVSESNKDVGVDAETIGALEGNGKKDEDGLLSTEGYQLTRVDPTLAEKGDALEMEDGMMIDNMEDQEIEAYDQRDGESDYETVDGGDFKTEDENAEPEDEYLDDEEGDDDFSSRIGAMLS